MRPIGEKVGGTAATVSKIEKGQRALKEEKIPTWAEALEVNEHDLHQLWLLCQGRVPDDEGTPTLYTDPTSPIHSEVLDPEILDSVTRHPDLRPIYLLTSRIIATLRSLLPKAHVTWGKFEPRFMDAAGEWATPEEEDLDWDRAPLPIIELWWRDGSEYARPAEIDVPLLDPTKPGDRRQTTSTPTSELITLIEALAATERDRVRGYIDAIIENRAAGSI